VRVDHGGGYVTVAEELLNGTDVLAALEQVHGERTAEGVTGDAFFRGGFFRCPGNGALDHRFVQMMATFVSVVVAPA
jgi:hypothetical protein